MPQVELDKLDYHHYLPIFFDGIREKQVGDHCSVHVGHMEGCAAYYLCAFVWGSCVHVQHAFAHMHIITCVVACVHIPFLGAQV